MGCEVSGYHYLTPSVLCVSDLNLGCIITYATRYTTAIDTAILTQTEAIYGAIAGFFSSKKPFQNLVF